MSHPRRIVWFCNTHSLARRPDDLARLRDAIGLPVLGAVSSIGTGDVTSVRVARLAAFGIMFGILVAAYGGMMLFGGELSENIRELGLERLL